MCEWITKIQISFNKTKLNLDVGRQLVVSSFELNQQKKYSNAEAKIFQSYIFDIDIHSLLKWIAI